MLAKIQPTTWLVSFGGVITLALLSAARPAVSTAPAADAARPDLRAIILQPVRGDTATDRRIARQQDAVRSARAAGPELERLGWLYVAKARESFDAGWYRLAEACAASIEKERPGSAEALLLRGHACQSMHRFHEAARIARELAARRDHPHDHGLLGDALLELGDLAGAAAAYQKMMDLRPDLQSYSRAAHLRWLKGDLDGAREAMRLAVSSGSPRQPEPLAWASTRAAALHWQAGATADASAALDAALALQPDYPPALLLRGRILLGNGDPAAALPLLERAVAAHPQAEYQWALADTRRLLGQTAAAEKTEAELLRLGASEDPRTLALFLATRRMNPSRAARLASKELESRADVWTHDAIAWAAHANGDSTAASKHLHLALAEGTRDARLFLHAGIITAASDPAESRRWLDEAAKLAAQLLPSERDWLGRAASTPAAVAQSISPTPETDTRIHTP